MDIIIPIVAESPFLISLLLFWFTVLAILLHSLWQWRQEHKRIQTLVDRIRAIHAQAGSRPRHLPSLAGWYRLFPRASTRCSSSTGNLTP